MSWLTETVGPPIIRGVARQVLPALIGAALGALAAVGLVPQELADCASGVQPIPFVSSSNSPTQPPAGSR